MGECSEGMFAMLWLRKGPLSNITQKEKADDTV